MDRDPEYLLDILDSIRLLQTYVAGVTKESDEQTAAIFRPMAPGGPRLQGFL